MTSQTSCSSVASVSSHCVVPRLWRVGTRSVNGVWKDFATSSCRLMTACEWSAVVARRRSVVSGQWLVVAARDRCALGDSRVQSATRAAHCRRAVYRDFPMTRLWRSCTTSSRGVSQRRRRQLNSRAALTGRVTSVSLVTGQCTSSASTVTSSCARPVLDYIDALTYVTCLLTSLCDYATLYAHLSRVKFCGVFLFLFLCHATTYAYYLSPTN